MKYTKYLLIVFAATLLFACGGEKIVKSPVDNMTKTLKDVKNYTIILNDMNVDGSMFKTYKHKYQVIIEKDSVLKDSTTKWYEVSKTYFMKNYNNMGMEVATKRNGKLKKAIAPPGYSNYVGNSNYGSWNNSGGNSFWEFYGKYAMISTMFHMATYPAYRSSYRTYNSSYRNSGRSYYGAKTGGSYAYGTNSKYNKSTRSGSSWSSKASNKSFRNKVNSRVSRSSSSSRSSSRRSSSSRSRSSSSGK